MHLLNLILMVASLAAAAAVTVVCGLGWVVWLAGGKSNRPDK